LTTGRESAESRRVRPARYNNQVRRFSGLNGFNHFYRLLSGVKSRAIVNGIGTAVSAIILGADGPAIGLGPPDIGNPGHPAAGPQENVGAPGLAIKKLTDRQLAGQAGGRGSLALRLVLCLIVQIYP